MRSIFLLLTLIACGGVAFAQGDEPIGAEQTVTFRFVPGDDMFYIPWHGNDTELTRLNNLIDEYRTEITSGAMPVYVDGYSPTKRLSFIRANRVKSEMILHRGLSEDNFVTKNYDRPYTAPDGALYRDMVMVTLRIPAKPEPKVEPHPEPVSRLEPEPKPEPAPEPEPQPIVVVDPQPGIHGLYLRSNLLYDALLTPTIGLEWRINDHVGIKLDGSWAHWGSSHGRVQKLWLVSPEVRWYLLDAKRFYVGLGANFGEANVYKGIASVLSSDTGYQGNLYGGGVTVGYNLAFNKCLSMDFNLGLGVTRFSYDTFTVSNGYRVYKDRDLTKNFWGPTQAGVSLVWRISNK